MALPRHFIHELYFNDKTQYALGNKSSYYIKNITWLRGNMKFISSVEQDISRVSAANE